MVRSRSGDSEAYRELLTEISDVIQAYLRVRFGDPGFVEECVQESLLAVHRARASYDSRRSFRAWLFAIVRHKSIDLLRRRGTRNRYEVLDPDEGKHAGHSPDPTDAIVAAQLLEKLEPEQREAIVMTKLWGLALSEAAERQGVSIPALKSRVSRGIRRLRALLEAEPGS